MDFYDCVVLGKGAIGSSAIFHLLEKGSKVLCIDSSKKHFDVMASYASGAMLGAISELSHLNLLNGMEEEAFIDARKYHDVFKEKLMEKSGRSYTIINGIFVIANGQGGDQDYIELRHQISTCCKYSLKYENVSPSNIPGFSPSFYSGKETAAYFDFDGTIESNDFLSSIDYAISKFSKEKYSLIQDQIVSIEKQEGCHSIKCKSGYILSTKNILFSTGAFSTKVFETIMLRRKKQFVMYAGRGVSLKISKINELENGIRTPNRDYACGLHLLPNSSSTYLGATNRFTISPKADENVPYINEIQFLINSSIQELNISIKQSRHQNSLVGYRPLLIDRRPVVGKLDDGFWIASGTYRNGMLLSPLIGKEISNAILENIEPREYWDSNRDIVSDFRNPSHFNNDEWVKKIKSEMVHHVSRRKDIFKTEVNKTSLKAKEYCDYIYSEVFTEYNIEAKNNVIVEAQKLFHKAPIRENIPHILNYLLSRYEE